MYPSLFLLLIGIAWCLQLATWNNLKIMSEWWQHRPNTEHRKFIMRFTGLLKRVNSNYNELFYRKSVPLRIEIFQYFSDSPLCKEVPKKIQEEEREFIHVHIYLAGSMLYFVCVSFCIENEMIWCSWSWTR